MGEAGGDQAGEEVGDGGIVPVTVEDASLAGEDVNAGGVGGVVVVPPLALPGGGGAGGGSVGEGEGGGGGGVEGRTPSGAGVGGGEVAGGGAARGEGEMVRVELVLVYDPEKRRVAGRFVLLPNRYMDWMGARTFLRPDGGRSMYRLLATIGWLDGSPLPSEEGIAEKGSRAFT